MLLRLFFAALAAILLLPATASAVGGASFSNTNAITIPAMGNATPYPSSILVTGMGGVVNDVNVTLHGVTHSEPADLDVVLVSPTGQAVVLMADRCGGAAASNATWTFDDNGAAPMPLSGPCTSSGPYDPGGSDTWPDPGPGEVDTHPLSLFNGHDPNGNWQLFVKDDTASNSGQIQNGWSLTVFFTPAALRIPQLGSANPFPWTHEESGHGPIVTDVDVEVFNVFHSHLGDLDMLLEGPQGQTAMLMSDACANVRADGRTWRFDDEAAVSMPEVSGPACQSGTVRPTDFAPADAFDGPAPPGPYGTSLGVFDLTQGNGTWKLWVRDDADDDEGFIQTEYDVHVTGRDPAPVAFNTAAATAVEGGAVMLDVDRADVGPTTEGRVRVQTHDGSATAGSDYTAVDETLVFAPGELHKSVSLPVASGGGDGTESFTVTLGEPSGDALPGDPSTATVTIPGESLPGAGGPSGGNGEPVVTLPDFTPSNAGTFPSPAKCRKRRSRVRLRPKAPRGVKLVRTVVRVNGHKLADRRGKHATDPVRVRIRRKRTRVVVKLTADDGRRIVIRRTYRRCRRRG